MCANTELGEMLKFPNLIQHFVKHSTNKTEHSLSFLGFMKNHYDSEKTHSDSDQHIFRLVESRQVQILKLTVITTR